MNNKVAIKCVDGVICYGDLVEDSKSVIIIKNLFYENVGSDLYVPNLKNHGSYYMDKVYFYKDNIVWISYQ